jgi:hypothetical protein
MNKRMGWENEATTRQSTPSRGSRCPAWSSGSVLIAAIGSPLRSAEPSNHAARIAWRSCRAAGGDQHNGESR